MATSTTAARSNGWLWFFVILVVLTVAAISTLVGYNLRQQLKREDLERARDTWTRFGPRDYDLDYLVKKQAGDPERYRVRVRDGKVVFVSLNDRPVESFQYRYYGVPAMFDNIEGFLDRDAELGSPRAFNLAKFDERDGHVFYYRRSIMGGRESLEITARLDPAGDR
jgi:hypothetical protein